MHPYFIGLSAFVGAGLVFAGITDTCGMGMMLARMPWNKGVGILSSEEHAMKIVIVGAWQEGHRQQRRHVAWTKTRRSFLLNAGAPSFANCGLPYYVGGVIDSRDKLLVAPKQRLIDRYRLDVRTRTEVLSIDRQPRRFESAILRRRRVRRVLRQADSLAGRVTNSTADSGCRFTESLYLARSARCGLAVAQSAMPSSRRHRGGFIGIEMAENLVHRGIATTVVELADQVLPPWDAEMVSPIAEHLRSEA